MSENQSPVTPQVMMEECAGFFPENAVLIRPLKPQDEKQRIAFLDAFGLLHEWDYATFGTFGEDGALHGIFPDFESAYLNAQRNDCEIFSLH